MRALGQHFQWNDRTYFYAVAGFWWCYTAGLIAWFMGMAGRDNAARLQCEATGNGASLGLGAQAALAAGMHLALFSWVIALAWNAHDRMTAGVITGLMAGMALWNIFKLRGLAAAAAAQVNCQHSGLCCVLILAILNLRMDVWLASHYGTSVAEIHQMLPMWVIPALTVALLGWITLLIAASHRQKPGIERAK